MPCHEGGEKPVYLVEKDSVAITSTEKPFWRSDFFSSMSLLYLHILSLLYLHRQHPARYEPLSPRWANFCHRTHSWTWNFLFITAVNIILLPTRMMITIKKPGDHTLVFFSLLARSPLSWSLLPWLWGAITIILAIFTIANIIYNLIIKNVRYLKQVAPCTAVPQVEPTLLFLVWEPSGSTSQSPGILILTCWCAT